jgi:Flp pilus assembly protein TadD
MSIVSRKLVIRGFFVLALGAVLSCGGPASSPEARKLLVVSPPADLEQQDPVIQQQFRQLHEALPTAAGKENRPPEALAQAYGELGHWFGVYEYVSLSSQCYAQAEELAPEDYRWPFYRAEAARLQGDAAGAMVHFRRSLSLRPTYVPAQVYLAMLAHETGDDRTATALLADVLEHDPDSPRALYEMGRIALADRDFTRARELLERAADLDPRSTEVQYQLGVALRGLGLTEEAEARMSRGASDANSRIPPPLDDPLMREAASVAIGATARSERARRRLQQGNVSAAIVEYRKSLAERPEDPTTWNDLTLALLRSEQKAEACEVAAEAAKRFPEHAVSQYALGACRQQSSQYAEAEAAFRRAVELDPDQARARDALGELLVRAGKYDEAVVHYRKLVELDPASESFQFRLAYLLLYLDRSAEARSVLESAGAVLPDSRRLDLLSARLLGTLAVTPAERQRAGELLRGGLAKGSSPFEAESIALTLAALGRLEEATFWQEIAVEIARRGGQPAAIERAEERLASYREHRRVTRAVLPGEFDAVAAPPGGGRSPQ